MNSGTYYNYCSRSKMIPNIGFSQNYITSFCSHNLLKNCYENEKVEII